MKKMKGIKRPAGIFGLLLLAAAAFCVTPAAASEYFVSPGGSDSADGLAPESAFETIGRGVSVLGPGDTLTILPGEYFEAVSARLAGEPDAPITIRAARPGTVLLRGCVDVSGFRPVEGARYTYRLDFDRRVEGVADRANLRLYESQVSAGLVEHNPGSFYQDPETGSVLVHAFGSVHPDYNALAFSVTDGFGLRLLTGSRDVVVEGLAFTGYNSRDFPEGPGSRNRWGLFVDSRGERITIRACTAFLNSGGIFLSGPTDSLVEGCHAFANFSPYQGLGRNILGWSVSDTAFRDNVVEHPWRPGDQSLTFYGGARADGNPVRGVMSGNLVVNSGIMIKGSANNEETVQEGNVIIGGSYFRTPTPSNLGLRDNEDERARRNFADPVAHDYRLQSDAPLRGTGPEGSDPGPFPYRDEVFFVSPGGDDANPGTSLALAWRTLSHAAGRAGPGDTVYVTGGLYRESLAPAHSGEPGRPVAFRRRGRERVVLDGGGELETGIDLAGLSHVAVSGFEVRGFTGEGIRAGVGRDIALEMLVVTGCGGHGVSASGVAEFALRDSLLRDNAAGGLRLARSPGAFLAGNILDRSGGPALYLDGPSLEALYSDYNAFPPAGRPAAVAGDGVLRTLGEWRAAAGQDRHSVSVEPGYRDPDAGDFSLLAGSALIGRGRHGRPAGPYLRVPVEEPVTVENLEARSVTATTAVIECRTPGAETGITIEWGETPELGESVRTPGGILHGVGLAGLEPGREYYFRARAEGTLTVHRWAHHDPEAKAPAAEAGEPLRFVTLSEDPPARSFHVSVSGDDAAGGRSVEDAWRTISHAASRARAGDTVIIHEGTYEEFVLVRATGDAHAPVTFRAAPGATVWMTGSDRTNPTAFRVADRNHVRIDGIRFRRFRNVAHGGGAISIRGGSGHVISRCFYDGRERSGYVGPFFRADDTGGLLVENCVMIGGMGAAGYLGGESDGAVFRHNVFYNQLIHPMGLNIGPVWVRPDWDPETVPVFTLSHNLICDSQPEKNAPLFRMWHLDSLRADHNGYFMRRGPEERRLVQARHFQGRQIGPEAREGFMMSTHQGRITWEVFRLGDIRERSGQEQGSFFGNPGFRAAAQLAPQGRRTAEWWRDEMHWDAESGAFLPLDFADFFADPAGPMGRSAAGRSIGLDPAAFEDLLTNPELGVRN